MGVAKRQPIAPRSRRSWHQTPPASQIAAKPIDRPPRHDIHLATPRSRCFIALRSLRATTPLVAAWGPAVQMCGRCCGRDQLGMEGADWSETCVENSTSPNADTLRHSAARLSCSVHRTRWVRTWTVSMSAPTSASGWSPGWCGYCGHCRRGDTFVCENVQGAAGVSS